MGFGEVEQKGMVEKLEDDLLEYAAHRGFGDIHMKVDPATGMRAIIAIHNTQLGPALGGCRYYDYPSTEAALYDVLRLARAMSYKAALTGIPHGGGKSVVFKSKELTDRASYFRAFGRFVHQLNGNYITAVDVGTTLDDMDCVGEETSYVASLSTFHGEPSTTTAMGVLRGIEAAVEHQLKRDDLSGVHVAIQGLGKVGFHLAKELAKRNAVLTITDIHNEPLQQAAKELGATVVSPDAIYSVECDIFSPCAMGAIINDETITQLRAPIIAGAANNQLARAYHGEQLAERNILYAPDYVINAGGLIHAAGKYDGTSDEAQNHKLQNIHNSLLEIFKRADEEKAATSHVADLMAEEILGVVSP